MPILEEFIQPRTFTEEQIYRYFDVLPAHWRKAIAAWGLDKQQSKTGTIT